VCEEVISKNIIKETDISRSDVSVYKLL